jgi:hypothetical protein
MKCPYTNPTTKQCLKCPLDECVRSLTADNNERKAEWIRKNPERRKAIRRRYYLNHNKEEKDYQRNYRAANIEEIRRKDRERKARIRERQAV